MRGSGLFGHTLPFTPLSEQVSYHPNFVLTRISTNEHLKTFPVSPSYIGFKVPHGEDTYRIWWYNPWWSIFLFWVCYTWMLGALSTHVYMLYRSNTQLAQV
jgi:hypothetical protein